MYQLLHWCKMRCPYTTHFAPMLQMAIVKNQNLPIVTLVQNALLLIQRILHQYNNLYILIFCYKMRWQCRRILHQKKKVDAKCFDMVHTSKCTNCYIGAKSVVTVQRILHQCNNWQVLIIKIYQLFHWCKMRCYRYNAFCTNVTIDSF